MSRLNKRVTRLEARRAVVSPPVAAAVARHQRRMTGLAAFIDEAFSDRRDCVAYHVAQVLGLPDAPAFRAFLQRQPLEEIARARYGIAWQTKMEATAAAAGVNCQAAHGVDWAAKFEAVWT